LNVDDEGFSAGPPPGDVIPDALVRAGEHLMDHLAQDFVLLGFAPLDAEVAEKAASIGVRLLTVGGDDIPDNAGHIAARFAAYPGTAYLIRPDGHVAARWQQPTADKLAASLHRARAH
jgi:3-(3-hydroxy-phenyl)propionate hydroxylase